LTGQLPRHRQACTARLFASEDQRAVGQGAGVDGRGYLGHV